MIRTYERRYLPVVEEGDPVVHEQEEQDGGGAQQHPAPAHQGFSNLDGCHTSGFSQSQEIF